MTLAIGHNMPTRTNTGIIRVLHVRTAAGNGGGPEKTLFNSARYLSEFGVYAEVLYLLDANTPCDVLIEQARQCEMPVHCVYERSAMDPSGVAAMARLVRMGGFHIVHTHDYKSNALARLLAPAGGYRVVATAHGYNRTTRREGCYYAMERLLLRRADAVICPSQDLADSLAGSGVGHRRLHVLHNGIILENWPFRPRRTRGGPLRVLYVGRLSREKNVVALLEACSALLRAGRSIRLSLAGEGLEREGLVRHAARLRPAPPADWMGHRTDVADLLHQADVFVNPSSAEAMPNSVLEALACGAPAVATDVGATRELIRHEQTGLLTPPGDVEALAAAIARLEDMPDFAQELAVRGRMHVEKGFSLATRMAHVVALYRGVMAAAGRIA